MNIRDEWSCLQCGQCKWFKVNAYMEGKESACKRLDHKRIKFAKPWFKTYDCGEFFGTVCRDFKPAAYCKWLCEHWKGFDDYFAGEEFKGTISLVLESDFSVRYKVRKVDFINNTFLDENGNLKWIEKEYYKRTKVTEKHPIGYKLVHEKNQNIKF